ncbi:M23 family metallopeptidase [uncultured Microbacterium sp.]|uniref:murein hydrolase activator EnvC family protein n=1 Tax=uncultured Microbacterium sp. TaxID=191216 RepID=UPI0028E5FE52|nr:M23 family metallopeptidase [uncultured Microbacterium sp.]
MTPPSPPRPRSLPHPSLLRVLIATLLVAVVLLCGGAPFPSPPAARAASAPHGLTPVPEEFVSDVPWRWPVEGTRRVSVAYRAPAHAYGPGHRGMDIVASAGDAVVAPAEGVVAFQGVVVDRPLLTIRHADGLVSTFEPLESPLRAGDPVRRGQDIGRVATGGHTPPGALHIGVRRDGEYLNPLVLFGGLLRARLLPCCDG